MTKTNDHREPLPTWAKAMVGLGFLLVAFMLCNDGAKDRQNAPTTSTPPAPTHHYSCADGSRFSQTMTGGLRLSGGWSFQPCPPRAGYPFGFAVRIWFPENRNTLAQALNAEAYGDPVHCDTSPKWAEMCRLVEAQLPR